MYPACCCCMGADMQSSRGQSEPLGRCRGAAAHHSKAQGHPLTRSCAPAAPLWGHEADGALTALRTVLRMGRARRRRTHLRADQLDAGRELKRHGGLLPVLHRGADGAHHDRLGVAAQRVLQGGGTMLGNTPWREHCQLPRGPLQAQLPLWQERSWAGRAAPAAESRACSR